MATPIVLQPKLNRLATNWAASNRRRSGSREGLDSAGCVLRRRRPSSMDDLLREFLTETGESLDVVDVELVRFEQEPNNTKILDNIFRLVHTIKGTCGFLGLPRLEALTHAAETLMGNFRGGNKAVTGEAVTLVLATIDRIKALLDELERNQAEPEGNDGDLIAELQRMSADASTRPAPASDHSVGKAEAPSPAPSGEIPAEAMERARRMVRATQAGKQEVQPA